jgi:hypothetical protein
LLARELIPSWNRPKSTSIGQVEGKAKKETKRKSHAAHNGGAAEIALYVTITSRRLYGGDGEKERKANRKIAYSLRAALHERKKKHHLPPKSIFKNNQKN